MKKDEILLTKMHHETLPVMYAVKRYNLKYIITDDMILSKLRRFSNSVKQHNFTFCLHWRQSFNKEH